jgi:hypothetical protein
MLPAERNQQTELTTQSDFNPFADFAQSISRSRIIGKLLKFTKHGDWIAGEAGEEMPDDARLIIHMGDMQEGWQKWEEGRPTEQRMSFIRDRRPDRPNVCGRAELGDTDHAAWEQGLDGRPRDPWMFTFMFNLMDEHGQLYTFSNGSDGTKSALKALGESYAVVYRHRPDDFPIVTLGKSGYNHKNKQIGWVNTPFFNVVGWANRSLVDQALMSASGMQETVPQVMVPQVIEEPKVTPLPKNDYAAAKDGVQKNAAKSKARF